MTQEWNVVISVNEGGYNAAIRLLREFGHVSRTDFFNVLVAKVDDIPHMLEALRERSDSDHEYLSCIARLIPASMVFTFQSADEFETQAADAVRGFAPAISGKSFHVRIHRRGFKGRFSSPEVERRLDAALLEVLEREGSTATIRFDDADAIIAIETVSNRAGVSLWSRDSMERYPFIRID